ncbi:DUF6626 family protein [Sphingobium xenophagum]|uniref:HTH cro/C1-type domain-containing protein n=1 Tax=Sphingobium xenophagum TaxID=121428 RepID=A0A401IY73_SPHXE|nr:DUF6626 family protein [Sphingobium xenophagum]MBY0582319.1 hypothetical protein [Sphingomonas sp.]GBH29361.1 hypothetical protein MBESOW_P0615 [Sphingobium xenophagum]
MILDEVFAFLKKAGVTRNHATFSTDFLGYSPRYYDYLRCSGARPSLRSLLKLAMCLQDMAHSGMGDADEVAAGDFAQRVMTRALTWCR